MRGTRTLQSRYAPQPQPTTVGFLLVPGFALMSYAAAVEPLRAANQLSGQHPVPLVARGTGRRAGRRLERRRHHPRRQAGKRQPRRHGLRLRRRQPGDLRRPRHLRLAPQARPARCRDRRHFRRALRAGQGRSARWTPGNAALGARRRLPRGLPRRRCRAVAVRHRRRPHHLLGRRLGARHDGGADRPRPRPRSRRSGRRVVPPHPHPRRHGTAADGPPPPPRRQRRETPRRAPRHGGEPRAAQAARGARPPRRRLAPATRAAVSRPARPEHPRPLPRAPPRPRPPAPPRDVAARARHRGRHRVRLGQPVQPRLWPGVRRSPSGLRRRADEPRTRSGRIHAFSPEFCRRPFGGLRSANRPASPGDIPLATATKRRKPATGNPRRATTSPPAVLATGSNAPTTGQLSLEVSIGRKVRNLRQRLAAHRQRSRGRGGAVDRHAVQDRERRHLGVARDAAGARPRPQRAAHLVLRRLRGAARLLLRARPARAC